MENINVRLNEKEYNEIKSLDRYDRNKYLEDNVLSAAIVYGYGFYGSSEPREENGEYLVNISIGSSCD